MIAQPIGRQRTNTRILSASYWVCRNRSFRTRALEVNGAGVAGIASFARDLWLPARCAIRRKSRDGFRLPHAWMFVPKARNPPSALTTAVWTDGNRHFHTRLRHPLQDIGADQKIASCPAGSPSSRPAPGSKHLTRLGSPMCSMNHK